MDEDKLKLLKPSSKKVYVEKKNIQLKEFLFNMHVFFLVVFIWAGYTLMVRYTRKFSSVDKLYLPTTVVVLSEVIKLCITLLFLFKQADFSLCAFKKNLKEKFLDEPREVLKMSVPSISYALQNNLDFIALSHLDAATYQLTTQLKIVTTAVFMVIILRRSFSYQRWIAILLLFGGVAGIQMDAIEEENVLKVDYVRGISAVLLTCITAGFAGVYFEMTLKDGVTSLWMRNLQLYFCGVFIAGIGCYLKDWSNIVEKGFFVGYDLKVFIIIMLLSCGGIYISLVIKYLDNMYKSFASAASIILILFISALLFDEFHFGFYFLFGSVVVCGSIMLYNSVNE